MEEETHHHNPHAYEETVKIPVKLLVYVVITLAILILAFFVIKSGAVANLFGGGDVSEKEATAKLLEWFVINVPDSEATFVSSSKQGSFYEITLSIDGQETPVYVTADGKYIITDMIPLD